MEEKNKNEKIFNILKEVLDANYKLRMADLEAQSAKDALLSKDRDKMIVNIGKYAHKYKNFINATSYFTNRWVEHKQDYYKDKSIEIIIDDLEFCITIVYLKVAVDKGLSHIVENKLKKIGIDELVLEGLSWTN